MVFIGRSADVFQKQKFECSDTYKKEELVVNTVIEISRP